MAGVFKYYEVTAYNSDGGAYRFLADAEGVASRQVEIFEEMGLRDAKYRPLLWDTRRNKEV